MSGAGRGVEAGLLAIGLFFAQIPMQPGHSKLLIPLGGAPTEAIPEVSGRRLGAALGTSRDPSVTQGAPECHVPDGGKHPPGARNRLLQVEGCPGDLPH